MLTYTYAHVCARMLALQDVFAMPSSVFVRDLGEYISELALNFSSRCQYDSGHYSEPLMYLECYKVRAA